MVKAAVALFVSAALTGCSLAHRQLVREGSLVGAGFEMSHVGGGTYHLVDEVTERTLMTATREPGGSFNMQRADFQRLGEQTGLTVSEMRPLLYYVASTAADGTAASPADARGAAVLSFAEAHLAENYAAAYNQHKPFVAKPIRNTSVWEVAPASGIASGAPSMRVNDRSVMTIIELSVAE